MNLKMWLANISAKVPEAYAHVPYFRYSTALACLIFMALVRKIAGKENKRR